MNKLDDKHIQLILNHIALLVAIVGLTYCCSKSSIEITNLDCVKVSVGNND